MKFTDVFGIVHSASGDFKVKPTDIELRGSTIWLELVAFTTRSGESTSYTLYLGDVRIEKTYPSHSYGRGDRFAVIQDIDMAL